MMRLVLLSCIAFGLVQIRPTNNWAEEQPAVGFRAGDEKVVISIGEQPVAEYVLRDENIPRPYFSHLRTTGGVQVTRNYPPREGDLDDHATFHPGLWMAFGDLSGADHWRLKAKVIHERFVEPPQGSAGRGGFTAEYRYLNEAGDATICRELHRVDIHVLPVGWLLVWDSKFSSDAGRFTFGDQEEMGLGVRLATPLAVVSGKGGRILDAEGRKNEQEVRGQAVPWCDYSGPLENRFVGVTLFSHPENFRPSWHHVRDYGLMVANPFGRNALTGGPVSRVTVKQGETFRLRFGVYVHETDTEDAFVPEDAFTGYLKLAGR